MALEGFIYKASEKVDWKEGDVLSRVPLFVLILKSSFEPQSIEYLFVRLFWPPWKMWVCNDQRQAS